MAHVKHPKKHEHRSNPDRRNGKAWKKGLPPEKREGSEQA